MLPERSKAVSSFAHAFAQTPRSQPGLRDLSSHPTSLHRWPQMISFSPFFPEISNAFCHLPSVLLSSARSQLPRGQGDLVSLSTADFSNGFLPVPGLRRALDFLWLRGLPFAVVWASHRRGFSWWGERAHWLRCPSPSGVYQDLGWNPCPLIGKWILNHWPTRAVPQLIVGRGSWAFMTQNT